MLQGSWAGKKQPSGKRGTFRGRSGGALPRRGALKAQLGSRADTDTRSVVCRRGAVPVPHTQPLAAGKSMGSCSLAVLTGHLGAPQALHLCSLFLHSFLLLSVSGSAPVALTSCTVTQDASGSLPWSTAVWGRRARIPLGPRGQGGLGNERKEALVIEEVILQQLVCDGSNKQQALCPES